MNVSDQQRSIQGNADPLGGEGFEEFFAMAERRLTVALVTRYGSDAGREAAADALAWAWEHWERVRTMDNAVGYLYRVGQTAARRTRWTPGAGTALHHAAAGPDELTDGGARLDEAVASLSKRQHQVTVLVHAYGFTHRETGDLLGISASSVQNHAERGMAKLRKHMETSNDQR